MNKPFTLHEIAQAWASLWLIGLCLLFGNHIVHFFHPTLSHAGSVYYIGAQGSTGNACSDGAAATKINPWCHAPGMPNFSGSYTHAAGDQILLRGGDTWHRSSGSLLIGGTWTWSNSGASGNPDYLGVDSTWFNSSTCGASWCRPIINGDNPLSTSQPVSCSFADDSITYVSVSGSFVTFDNVEFTGDCQTTQSFINYVTFTSGGHNRIASNLYFHGWTLATTATDDRKIMLNSGDSSSPPTDIATLNVFDGRDSSLGTVCPINSTSCVAACWNGSGAPTNPCATGWAMGGNWGSINKSIFVLVSNAMQIGDVRVVHDVVLDHIFESIFVSRHSNGFETLSSIAGCTFTAWNSVVRNINAGENWNSACATQVFYNFVSENDQHFPPDPNCFLMEPLANNSSAIIDVDFRQSTIDNTCKLGAHSGTWAAGSSSQYQNMHLIGFTSIANWVACNGQTTCSTTQTDNGGEVFMTTGNAATQGYALTNDFAPTLVTNSTIGAGNNLTLTCGTGNFTSDLCSGTTNGCSEISGSGGFVAHCPMIAANVRPGLPTAWNAGGYQFTLPSPTSDANLQGVTNRQGAIVIQ